MTFSKAPFGVLDSIFDGPDPTGPTFTVAKMTRMKDGVRAVLLISDGGSRFTPEDPSHRFYMRCIVNRTARIEACSVGSLVRLNKYSKTFVGDQKETILTADDVDVVGHDTEFDPLRSSSCVRHPLNPGGPEIISTGAPPPQQQQTAPAPSAYQGGGGGGGGALPEYGAVRKAANGVVARPADPYASSARPTPIATRVDASVIPINDLNMFNQKFTIKARVSSKSDMKTFNNAKGEGKFFCCDLLDKDGGEIRSTFFNKAADKFFSFLDEGQVFLFSKGQIKTANKRFNPLQHHCELSFGEDAEIRPVGADPAIPKKTYVFTKIEALNEMKKGDSVDIIAIVINPGVISSITLKSGENKDKRDMSLLDDSGFTIDLTLWGEKCRIVDEEVLSQKPVIALKGARVDEFQGRKLSVSFETKIEINPDVPQAPKLIRWFEERGETMNTTSLSKSGPSRDPERCSLAQIQAQATSQSNTAALEDKGLWFTTVATLHRFDTERRYFWIACPDCNKKVQDLANDGGFGPESTGASYFCANCNKTVPRPTKKFILTVELKDSTDSLRCMAMAEHAQSIIGCDCSVVFDAREQFNDGRDDHDFFLWKQFREYVFRIQAKNEVYMDEKRIKYRIFGAEPVEGNVVAREAQSKLGLIRTLLSCV